MERALLAAVSIHLCALPWWYGAMGRQAQIASLVAAGLGFMLASVPRVYTGQYADGGEVRYNPWHRLIRFPIFWLGLALIAYMSAQTLNPSWSYRDNGVTWWLTQVKYKHWLPTGIEAPFLRFNGWRQIIIYASAWLVVCSIWTGFRRRRSIRMLLTLIVTNALLLGAAGVVQKLDDSSAVFGLYEIPTIGSYFSSFIYKNHAGAYFGFCALVAVAVSVYSAEEARRRLSKSSPAGLFALAALGLAFVVLFSLSRGAGAVLGGCALVFALWFLIRQRKVPGHARHPGVTVIVSVLFGTLLVATFRFLDFSDIRSGFDRIVVEQVQEASFRSRLLANQATIDMIQDTGPRGIGAGGFRHLFPKYVQKYPEIYGAGRNFWEHAHNDWLQITAELGAIGVAILVAGAAWWMAVFTRARALWHPLAIPLLIGCVGTLVHAWVDFPLQCPAILITWCATVALAARAVEGRGTGDERRVA